MLRQFIQHENSIRANNITNGLALFKGVTEDQTYNLKIRDGVVSNSLKINDEYIFWKNQATSILEDSQDILIPYGSNLGTIELFWNKYPNYLYAKRLEDYFTLIDNNKNANKNYTITGYTTTTGDPAGYYSSLLLADGRILGIPNSTHSLAIFNGNVLEKRIGSAFTTTNAYIGGSLLPDGNVILPPFNAGQALLIDPIHDTTELVGDDFGTTLQSKYYGSILLPDGRVIFVPNRAAQAAVYDPVSKTTTLVGADIGDSNQKFNCGALLPNGKILLVPLEATQLCIFDPDDYSYTNIGIVPSAAYRYQYAIWVKPDKLLLIARGAPTFVIVDYPSYAITEIGPSDSTAWKYGGACLLPDGRVFITNQQMSSPIILDVDTQTITEFPVSEILSQYEKLINPILLPNGHIICLKCSANQTVNIEFYIHEDDTIELPTLDMLLYGNNNGGF